MEYQSFDTIYPKIAEKETRLITVSHDDNVPIGDYAILPSFCMDKTCDCRRALINVVQVNPDHPKNHAATISYGWENIGFYKTWGKGMPLDMLQDFKGPSLEGMQRQSAHADYLLDFFKNNLLKEEEYVRRIQRHYAYIKMKQMKKLPKDLNRLIDYFGKCPCGSEKIFRMCCGKKKLGRR